MMMMMILIIIMPLLTKQWRCSSFAQLDHFSGYSTGINLTFALYIYIYIYIYIHVSADEIKTVLLDWMMRISLNDLNCYIAENK